MMMKSLAAILITAAAGFAAGDTVASAQPPVCEERCKISFGIATIPGNNATEMSAWTGYFVGNLLKHGSCYTDETWDCLQYQGCSYDDVKLFGKALQPGETYRVLATRTYPGYQEEEVVGQGIDVNNSWEFEPGKKKMFCGETHKYAMQYIGWDGEWHDLHWITIRCSSCE